MRLQRLKSAHCRLGLVCLDLAKVEILNDVCGCIRDERRGGCQRIGDLPLRDTAEDAKARLEDA